MSGSSFQLSLISGERVYEPGKITPMTCGFKENALCEDYQKTDKKVLIAWHSKKIKEASKGKSVDFPVIYEYQRACFTSTNRPKSLLYIYERNDLALQEDWQNARCMMLELAYASNKIYSIAFHPKNPCQRQTWAMQKQFFPQDPRVTEDDNNLKIRVDYFETVGSKNSFEAPQVMKGMLKPYPTYQSCEYAEDTGFNKTPIEVLDEESFQEVSDQNLKHQLNKIGGYFEKDTEADEMAIIYFQPDHPTNKICRRLFIKTSN